MNDDVQHSHKANQQSVRFCPQQEKNIHTRHHLRVTTALKMNDIHSVCLTEVTPGFGSNSGGDEQVRTCACLYPFVADFM